jgi:hypothetical protein
MMMLPYSDGTNSIVEALPLWEEAGELSDHRQYIFHYHTMMCPQFMNGYCPRHKAARSAPPQCFCYHFESQRRRPLVDTLTGQLRYWDVLCDRIAEGEECLAGDLCPFSHTREEISYHAAKYKTKLCNDRDCRGKEVCCFAHGEEELRTQALDRYSYWSIFGALGAPGPRQPGPAIDLAMGQGYARNGLCSATGALYHPKVYKHRFCASYPNISGCRRGEACAFAHSREEIRTSLLAEDEELQRPNALTDEFFMYKFKTLWCPIGVQHDWQTCVYAHNYQDARRHPGIGYGPRPCPYWKRKETTLEYSQRCPLGVRCSFSHGAKEQLYHPSYFKTVTCQDWPNSNCPRGKLCAFWHRRSQQRTRGSVDDDFNYKLPLAEGSLSDSLQADFLSPPFKLLNSLQADQEFSEFMGDPDACQDGLDMSMGQMMPLGGTCEPCQMQNGSWGQSDMPANFNYGSPATPTTTADSDEAASADSSLSGDKSQSNHDEDRSGGHAAATVPNMDSSQMMLPPHSEISWKSGCDPTQQVWTGENGWAAPPSPYLGDACMPSPQMGPGSMAGSMLGGKPSSMPGAMPAVMQGNAGPGSMVPGGVAPGGMPPNFMPGEGFQPCGPMPGCPPMQQQQMIFYQVPPAGSMGPPQFQSQQQCNSPMSPMGPQSPQMMPMPQPSYPGCQNFSQWGQPIAKLPDGTFVQGQLMTIEELPVQAFPAVQNGGKPELPAIKNGSRAVADRSSEFFPAPGASSPCGGDEAMPTCNGFIHFKDDTSEGDMTPSGRPRANSH